jgi:tRNA U34 5-methylaminomethyl-2-thiouridine-forming methyltransferase MnmC
MADKLITEDQTETDYEIVRLKNGISSLRSRSYGETYHPVIGPVAEAKALYVDQLHLKQRLLQSSALRKSNLAWKIWDIGLGAAANILTVLSETRGFPVNFQICSFDQTVEPMKKTLENQEHFPYITPFQEPCQELLACSKTEFVDDGRHISWELFRGDFPEFLFSSEAESIHKPDLILFDAFSPAKNPEMWTLPLFRRIFELLDPSRPCALPTYSRSTMLRVTLLLAGFYVGVGQSTGEKEETTIAANNPAMIEQPLGADWLKRVRNSTSAEPLMEPAYAQKPLSSKYLDQILDHPQFSKT